MNRIQQLNMDLIRESSFNSFDGEQVASALTDHPELWRGVVLDRMDSLIKLRDIADGHWNVDTLFILPKVGKEDELKAMADTWDADEVDWIEGKEAAELLGAWLRGSGDAKKVILRVWWD